MKESYLTSQKTLQTSCEIPQQNELGTETQNQTVVNPRRSNRKSLTYSSSNAERKCIIFNENKYHKGRLLPLCNITLKQVDSQIYKAEEKLIKFAHLHIDNNNLKYIDAANRRPDPFTYFTKVSSVIYTKLTPSLAQCLNLL